MPIISDGSIFGVVDTDCVRADGALNGGRAAYVSDRYATDGLTIMYQKSPKSPFELELTINHDRDKSYDIVDGYGRLAVVIFDINLGYA